MQETVEMNKSVASTYGAIDILDDEEDKGPLIDLKIVARKFIQQRLSNTSTVEEIRAKALTKLSAKLDDPEQRFSPSGLLEIIDTLNNSSKEDMNAIMKAGTDSKSPGNGSQNYYNIFMNGSEEGSSGGSVPSKLPVQSFLLLDKLVTAATSVIENNKTNVPQP